jgi:hypothetical protein
MAMMKFLIPFGSVLGAAAGYISFVRPWQLIWGSTKDEACGPWPGDELIANPTIVHTRAVTVHAPARDIWPWLLQLGQRESRWLRHSLFRCHRCGVSTTLGA